MSFHLGQRLSYSGELCTVKFMGEIPAWEDQQALGVEWDNTFKGKHNGYYKDTQYFKVQNLNSGSFLKSNKKHDGYKDFYSALLDTYADDFKASEIKIGSKVVESLGFDKLQRLQSDFHYLKDISLSRKRIKGVLWKDLELIADGLKNLKSLDLSFNLFEDFNDIVLIIKGLKNLRKLKLTGNRFHTTDPIINEDVVESVESIDLSLTLINNDLLNQLSKVFPNLKELHLTDNNYSQLPTSVQLFKNIHTLNVSFNKLDQIPTIVSQIPSLRALNMADNKLETLLPKTAITLANVEEINLRRNNICQWKEVDQIAISFPKLINLSVNHNPLFDKLSIEESEFSIIARIPSIAHLNGVSISPRERTNAELYFISQVNNGSVGQYNNDRFKDLLRIHKKKSNSTTTATFINDHTINSSLITLNFQYGSLYKTIQLLLNIEVKKLKGILSRLFDIRFTDMALSYQMNGAIVNRVDKNTALISSFAFEENQLITISKVV